MLNLISVALPTPATEAGMSSYTLTGMKDGATFVGLHDNNGAPEIVLSHDPNVTDDGILVTKVVIVDAGANVENITQTARGVVRYSDGRRAVIYC